MVAHSDVLDVCEGQKFSISLPSFSSSKVKDSLGIVCITEKNKYGT